MSSSADLGADIVSKVRALPCARDKARASIENRTLQAGHEVFRAHLVPVQPQTPFLIPPRTGIFPRRPAALPPRSPAIPQPAVG
jgi:cell division septation protein DedD